MGILLGLLVIYVLRGPILAGLGSLFETIANLLEGGTLVLTLVILFILANSL